MINESFNKVGINEFCNNSMALMDAQELTNESAEICGVSATLSLNYGLNDK